MKKFLFAATSFLFISAFLAGTVMAAGSTLIWPSLQNRTYENGNSFNRLAFSVVDTDTGEHLTTDTVQSLSLYAPGGSQINLQAHVFMFSHNLYGHYNAQNDAYEYDEEFSDENYYRANFITPALEQGTYRLEITFNDGSDPQTEYITYNGLKDLPQISAKSFWGYEDASGNFVWGWKSPYAPDMYADGAANTSVRCWLSLYNAGIYWGDIWFKVPTQVSMMFIPKTIMDVAKTLADGFFVGVHIRTNDNNNRRYASDVSIDKLRPDHTRAVVIPLY